MQPVHVIGGGLAGSEAAWQIASRGVPAMLHEMRPHRTTAVHKTAGLAELVCSNSFRSDDREHNAVGLLHEEMRRAGSLMRMMWLGFDGLKRLHQLVNALVCSGKLGLELGDPLV